MKLEITPLLAVYGAVVSSFVAGWNVLRDLRDRPSIKVKARIGYVITNPGQNRFFLAFSWTVKRGAVPEEEPLLKVTFTNTGRRQITLNAWGAELKKGSSSPYLFCAPRDLPKSLAEGESIEEFTSDFTIIGEETKRIWVQDSTERYWYLPRKDLETARKDQLLLTEYRSSYQKAKL